jgi:single stranded DNA-binding protein
MFNVNNCCQFEGRIAKDPEFKTVGQGKNAFNKALFTLAVDRSLSKDQRDAKRNGDDSIVSADFPQFVANGAKADIIRDYFCKGKPIKIWATYQSYVTQDQNGNKRYGHIFVVEELGFVLKDTTDQNNNGGNNNNRGNNNRNNNNYNNNNYNNNNSRNNNNSNDDYYPISDGDVPF